MSPSQLNNGKPTYTSPLKINKDSHLVKKPPSPPSSSAAGAGKPPHRQPVIIYTHSPKIIHTHPRDFMALVQKLTGQSSVDSESGHPPPPPKQEPPPPVDKNGHRRAAAAATAGDDTDSSSVITDENCSSTAVRNVEIKSCFPPPPATLPAAFYDPPPIGPCFNNMSIPFFPAPNSGGFHSSGVCQPFFGNYNDSLLLMNNMRSSISSSSPSFQGSIKEFPEF